MTARTPFEVSGRVGVPEANRAVRRAAGELLPVRADGEAVDEMRVPVQRQCLDARARLPNLDRTIARTAEETFAVGAEGQRQNALAQEVLPSEKPLAGGNVPHFKHLVAPGKSQPCAVGIEGQRVDFAAGDLELDILAGRVRHL